VWKLGLVLLVPIYGSSNAHRASNSVWNTDDRLMQRNALNTALATLQELASDVYTLHHMRSEGENFLFKLRLHSGFGGLEVACWPLVLKFAGSNPAEVVGFFGRKNPHHAFLRRGSKAVCPMSCFTACKGTQKWRGSRHFRQNFSAISRPYFHLPLLGWLAPLQTLGVSCSESWNALNPWFSSKLGVGRASGNGTL
jgi:hypothetical protein